MPVVPSLLARFVKQFARVRIFGAAELEGEKGKLGKVFVLTFRSASPALPKVGIYARLMQRDYHPSAPDTGHDHKVAGMFGDTHKHSN